MSAVDAQELDSDGKPRVRLVTRLFGSGKAEVRQLTLECLDNGPSSIAQAGGSGMKPVLEVDQLLSCMKVDVEHLFLQWLAQDATQLFVDELVQSAVAQRGVENGVVDYTACMAAAQARVNVKGVTLGSPSGQFSPASPRTGRRTSLGNGAGSPVPSPLFSPTSGRARFTPPMSPTIGGTMSRTAPTLGGTGSSAQSAGRSPPTSPRFFTFPGGSQVATTTDDVYPPTSARPSMEAFAVGGAPTVSTLSLTFPGSAGSAALGMMRSPESSSISPSSPVATHGIGIAMSVLSPSSLAPTAYPAAGNAANNFLTSPPGSDILSPTKAGSSAGVPQVALLSPGGTSPQGTLPPPSPRAGAPMLSSPANGAAAGAGTNSFATIATASPPGVMTGSPVGSFPGSPSGASPTLNISSPSSFTSRAAMISAYNTESFTMSMSPTGPAGMGRSHPASPPQHVRSLGGVGGHASPNSAAVSSTSPLHTAAAAGAAGEGAVTMSPRMLPSGRVASPELLEGKEDAAMHMAAIAGVAEGKDGGQGEHEIVHERRPSPSSSPILGGSSSPDGNRPRLDTSGPLNLSGALNLSRSSALGRTGSASTMQAMVESGASAIPTFYVPGEGGRGRGRPLAGDTLEERLPQIVELFTRHSTTHTPPVPPSVASRTQSGRCGVRVAGVTLTWEEAHAGLPVEHFAAVAKTLCGFPSFFAAPLFRRVQQQFKAAHGGEEVVPVPANAGDKRSNSVVVEDDVALLSMSYTELPPSANEATERDTSGVVLLSKFCAFWRAEIERYDNVDRFFRLVKQRGARAIYAPDFMPFLEELLAFHPGLAFLETAPEFQEKYARTVIARIFYCLDTGATRRIEPRQLRRSRLLEAFHTVDVEEDINVVNDYFSYEHFYVLYCKFWELDADHDFMLSRTDLSRMTDLTNVLLDRLFQHPGRPFQSGVPGKMGYEDFIFFFMSEEDKTSEAAIRYWFTVCDVDGDGVLTVSDLAPFYREQEQRMRTYGMEVIPFADVFCQLHDLLKPAQEGRILLRDFLHPERVKLTGVLFSALFNLAKFQLFESRDPMVVKQELNLQGTSQWDRYAQIEYTRLASEEEEAAASSVAVSNSVGGGAMSYLSTPAYSDAGLLAGAGYTMEDDDM